MTERIDPYIGSSIPKGLKTKLTTALSKLKQPK